MFHPGCVNRERVGTIRYGFDLEMEGHAVVENFDEQVVIRDIHEARASGKTFRSIARALTERGVPTKSGRSSTWQGKTVQMILARSA